MGEQHLCCHSAGKEGRLVSSTGVRACSWTLQIPEPSWEVVAGEQVSLELTDSSLVVWCGLLSPSRVVISPPPLLPALYTARLGSSHFTQHIRQSFTALPMAMWPSPSNLVDLGWADPSAWHLFPLGVAWLTRCVLLVLLVPAVTHRV